MKDLGIKRKKSDLYPLTPGRLDDEKETVDYRNISVPMTILGDKSVDIDDEITLVLKGKVRGLSKNSDYNKEGSLDVEVHEGDIEADKKEAKSLLGKE